MQAPGLPDNEAARLATLHGLNILDTPRDDRFDRYTRIAARIFDMPIATISLVDQCRQWFKSAEGLDVDETPRDISFCGHAILGDDVFEVRNTRRDPRFRNNPLVVDHPHIRFYAGAPLRAPNGVKLGTLCIIDRVPRRLSDEDKTMLRNLANMVVEEMITYVDTETGLADRDTQIVAGARFFDDVAGERGLSLLLFDISVAFASHNDSDTQLSPGEIFAKLLHSHFPAAQSIAHIGGYRFGVLLKDDVGFDDSKATNRLCAVAKKLLRVKDGSDSLSPYVGRIQFNPDKYDSIDDMLNEADGMYVRHEREPLPHPAESNRFLTAVTNWRKTIY